MRFIVPFVFFIATAGLLWKSLKLKPAELPSVLVGHKAPAFSLTTVEDPTRVINENVFKGQVTVLNIWASWCSSCKKEHPIWVELTKKYPFSFISVSYHDDLKAAQQWLQKSGNPYSFTLFDPQGHLGMDYGVYGIPETFILDKEGIIRYRHAGPISLQLWQQTLLPLIESLR